jgi:GT2 family glycosyltransferase
MISIIIPTCTFELVKPCVDSIIKYTNLDDTEIIVVANGAEKEVKNISGIKVLWFNERIGATKALNEGIKVAKGEYIILLNDDVELLEQPKNSWIETLLAPFSDPKVGITGPLKNISPSVGQEFIVFFCVMIKKSIFDEIGLLDETFQCGCDMDFCMRTKEKGYSLVQVPNNLLTTGPQFWVGNFPIWHKGEKTVHVKIPSDEWHKIFTNDTERLVERYGVGKKMNFSIIIPTCTFELLHKCISSIVANTDLSNAEVIIVSNGAEEKTKEFVYSLGNRFRLIWFDKRIGATKALNEGIKASRGEYVVLLNDDVIILGKEWIPMLIKPFSDPKVGITGPIKGIFSLLDRYFVLFFCCTIRKKIFDELGFLDEIFSPGGFEDIDFCFRVEDAGWKLLQVPDINPLNNDGRTLTGDFPIWHIEGNTIRQSKDWEEICNRNLNIIKNRYSSNVIKIDWPCAQKKPELNMLQRFLVKQNIKIEKILEIGTYRGGTTTLWAKMVEPNNGKVYCVDQRFNWDSFWEANFFYKGQVYENIPQRKFINEIQGSSHDIDIKNRVYNEVEQVNLLFIDGDHSYEGVKDDFNSFSQLVKPGGFVIFHDIVDSEYHRGMGCFVAQFWNEIKNKYEYKEFIDTGEYPGCPSQSMGIGVLKIV